MESLRKLKHLFNKHLKKSRSVFFMKAIVLSLLLIFTQAALFIAQSQEADIQEVADKLLLKISQRLQLPIKYKLRIDFKDRDELKNYLIEKLNKDYPEEKLIAIERAYAKIGLLPKDLSLEKFLIELYSEQVAGFYNPETKNLCLIEGFDPVLQQAIMVHELTHALQDQHFNLMQLIDPDINNDDLLLAHETVIEGQATAVMLEIFSGLNITQLPDLGPLVDTTLSVPMFADSSLTKAPEYIKKHLLFPYSAGTSFIKHYYSAHHSYNSFQLFSQIPASTEQIIHFEKYFNSLDEPTSIRINDLESYLQPAWNPLYSDVMGELDFSILLNTFLPAEEAKKAAEGWDGSRFYTFERSVDAPVLLIWLSTFDGEADALEFFRSYKKIIDAKYKEGELLQKEDNKFFQWETEEGLVYLEQRESDVLVIEGIDRELLPELINRCFQATKSPY